MNCIEPTVSPTARTSSRPSTPLARTRRRGRYGRPGPAPNGRHPCGSSPTAQCARLAEAWRSPCARITVDGVPHEVGPETAVFVPPDVYHSIESIGDAELRLTFTLSPPGYENVFRELARARTDHPPVPA